LTSTLTKKAAFSKIKSHQDIRRKEKEGIRINNTVIISKCFHQFMENYFKGNWDMKIKVPKFVDYMVIEIG
jgi:hypothetical protein